MIYRIQQQQHPVFEVLFIVALLTVASTAFVPSPTTSRATTTRTSLLAATTAQDVLSDKAPSSDSFTWTLEEFSDRLEGSGKAKAVWECLRLGIDPVWYFDAADGDNEPEEMEPLRMSSSASEIPRSLKPWTRIQIHEELVKKSPRGSPTVLGRSAVHKMKSMFGGGIEESIARLANCTTSTDGTTKLLLELVEDGMLVETVIIPWDDRQKSTICVSSQVGCRQACTFCSTGRMGYLRSLSISEILAQLYWAQKICRTHDRASLYHIDNCVFMGMGEPADNAEAVVEAATAMVDRNLFQLAPRKVTISTIAPSPECFVELGKAPVVLAWSVHSSRDNVRQQLVPTTKHEMKELRQGLITVLQGRSKRLRNVMLEITLLDQINDSIDDADHLAEFCRPLLEEVQGLKLVVNLIPWNDISATFGPASAYRKPKTERVLAYQNALVEKGILSYVRTTRGDEEDAACGMLSTKNRRN